MKSSVCLHERSACAPNPSQLHRSRAFRPRLGSLRFAAVFAVFAMLGATLQAQTAHVGGTVATLGSGFLGPQSVAVDGSGNVFVADTYNNAVKEIVAAGGYTAVKTLGSGFRTPLLIRQENTVKRHMRRLGL